MEQKKNDSCSIQKSSFRKLKTLFYFHYTLVGAVQRTSKRWNSYKRSSKRVKKSKKRRIQSD